MSASLFGDPLWLHTPNPALADKLEAERHGFGGDFDPAIDDPQPRPTRTYGDTDHDRAQRLAELDAAMHPPKAGAA